MMSIAVTTYSQIRVGMITRGMLQDEESLNVRYPVISQSNGVLGSRSLLPMLH